MLNTKGTAILPLFSEETIKEDDLTECQNQRKGIKKKFPAIDNHFLEL